MVARTPRTYGYSPGTASSHGTSAASAGKYADFSRTPSASSASSDSRGSPPSSFSASSRQRSRGSRVIGLAPALAADEDALERAPSRLRQRIDPVGGVA